MTITIHPKHKEPALGHAELKKAAVSEGGNVRWADADAGSELYWGWSGDS